MLKHESFILQKTATPIAVLVQILAVYLFFRGHNEPGGGFIAGVASGIGALLLVLANGTRIVPKICPIDPLRLCAWGLMTAFVTGTAGLLMTGEFLTHFHYKNSDFPFLGSLYLGTPLLFDLGVFLVVFGVILKIAVVLMDAVEGQKQALTPAFSLPMSGQDHLLEETTHKQGDSK